MRGSTLSLVAIGVALGAFACSASKDSQQNPPNLKPDGTVGETGETPLDGGFGFDASLGPDALVDVGPTKGLSIVPADHTVILVGGAPAKVDYAAQAMTADGAWADITPEASWSIDDPTLGTFAGNVLTATKAGKTNVTAKARGQVVTTSLTISPPVVVTLPGAPGDAPGKFGGGVDASRAPSFVYPPSGVLVPPNMNVLEIHFMPGTGNSLFELAFSGPGVDVKVYMKCDAVGAGCVYTPDATVWKLVAENGRGRDPITLELRGVDGASPGKVGVSPKHQIGFAEEDLAGGIYYWNAKAGATMRYEFGVSGKAGEVYMNAPSAGATTCVGCHVLSRNGKRIALGLDIPAPSPYKVYEVATKTMVYQQGTAFGGGSNFFSFNPDATRIATSNGISIVIRDAKTGAPIAPDPLVPMGAMPDWSPDGKTLVYAKPATAPPCIGGFCGAPGVDSASLETITFDGTSWSKGKSFVPFGGANNYYPAFSPDGAWVVFNRSPGNQNSMDAKDAQVWVVPASGGSPIRLVTASTGGDSWPKWTPHVQKHRGGQLLWTTFSSRRSYGLRVSSDSTAQIWMTALDPGKAKSGGDPSYPAFWLPFQDLGSGNHIAQWVTKVERKPCTSMSECPTGEVCKDGVCKPVIK